MTEPEPPAVSRADIRRFIVNFRDEVDGQALYLMLAEAEKDPQLREVFTRLAAAEGRHLAIWEEKLRSAGVPPPPRKPSWRVRVLGFVARRFGVRLVTPIITQMEMAATDVYDDQPDAVAHGLPAEERSHARLFREIGNGRSMRAGAVDIARIEGRHAGASSNALRAVVLGANDGLVSNLSLVMGVAGADPGRDVILLTGVAGLLAGALSMALGEWISVRSSAEAYERQVSIERTELEHMPEEEMEELVLIYQAKGLSETDARETAERIMARPAAALDTLVREELGMAEDEVGSPWAAAIYSFVMFAGGAILPVLPWFFTGGFVAVAGSVVLSATGLFLLGAAVAIFTGRSAIFSGGRMLGFGLAAAAITFAIGTAIGAGAGI